MQEPGAPTMALMRRFPETFVPFYAKRGVTISAGLAQRQLEAYADALRAAGLKVVWMDADPHWPDCVFVEDPAVVAGGRALIGRLAPHREGEPAAVARILRRWHEVVELPPGAQLEGGDVMHAGGTTYVGITRRTNERGAAALAEFLAPGGRRVVPVRVDGWLHLKTAATYLGDGTLIAVPDLDLRAFEVDEVLTVAPGEPGAANCLRVRDRLLVRAGCPGTERRLREFAARRAVEVVAVDTSEFAKAEGSLTCLSIIW